MENQSRKKGMIEMLICAALWSSAGILIKLLPWNGFAVASIRSLIAGLTILIYALATGRKMIVNRKTLLGGLLTGGVYTCFSCANKLTTAANALGAGARQKDAAARYHHGLSYTGRDHPCVSGQA